MDMTNSTSLPFFEDTRTWQLSDTSYHGDEVPYQVLPPELAATTTFDLYDTAMFPYPIATKRLPMWEISNKIFFYVVIILVALLGNGLVVATVLVNLRMRTTTNFYIVNLAVSDLMVTLSCTWVHLVDDLTEGWVLGAFFCKFNSFVQGRRQLILKFMFIIVIE